MEVEHESSIFNFVLKINPIIFSNFANVNF